MNRLSADEPQYLEWFEQEPKLTGLMLIRSPYSFKPAADGRHRLLLAVYDEEPGRRKTEYGMCERTRVEICRISLDKLHQGIVSGDNPRLVQWLMQGTILLDRSGALAALLRKCSEWPPLLREQKLLCEFSRFLQTYLQAKQDLHNGQILDAYANILASLHHWAHIALVESGMHPELTVWEQMRRVNPGIYKLYEELTTSAESVEQRVQLVLLACEFSVMTKMKSSCALLVRLLASRPVPWTVAELQRHPDLAGFPADLPLLLQKLAHRGVVREMVRPSPRGSRLIELQYSADPGAV